MVIVTAIRWFSGIAIGICALASLFMGQVFTAFFWAFFAVIVIPPASLYVERKTKWQMLSWQKIVLAVLVYFAGAATFEKPPKTSSLIQQSFTSPAVVRDTIFVHDTILKEEKTVLKSAKKFKKKAPVASSKEAVATSPQMYSAPIAKPKAKRQNQGGCNYNGHSLYVGARGGCYYINSNGNKTYVDRSYCSGCY